MEKMWLKRGKELENLTRNKNKKNLEHCHGLPKVLFKNTW